VNLSTSEKMFVWRSEAGEADADADAGDAAGTAFSFPLRLVNAFKNPELVTCFSGACGFNVAVAGWKLA